MTRFQTRWMQLVCVLFVGEQSLQKYYINACKKNIYILFKNTLNLSTAYICIISISYLSRIVQDGFLCQFWHFLVRESRWIWIALHSHFCWYKAGSSLKNARCIMINLCSWRIDAKKKNGSEHFWHIEFNLSEIQCSIIIILYFGFGF